MFGMLDYRAYKLLWLICRPFSLIILIAELGAIAVAIMISASLHYNVLVRIVIAIAILIGAVIIITIFRRILWWFVTTWFFWLVDVVPAKGESVAESTGHWTSS